MEFLEAKALAAWVLFCLFTDHWLKHNLLDHMKVVLTELCYPGFPYMQVQYAFYLSTRNIYPSGNGTCEDHEAHVDSDNISSRERFCIRSWNHEHDKTSNTYLNMLCSCIGNLPQCCQFFFTKGCCLANLLWSLVTWWTFLYTLYGIHKIHRVQIFLSAGRLILNSLLVFIHWGIVKFSLSAHNSTILIRGQSL